MNADHASKIASDALNQLASDLEAGRSQSLVRYLEVMSRFHTYSWGNSLLILLQKPDATRVAGFHAWRTKFKRTVRKGERGIAIFAPMLIRPKTGGDAASSGEAGAAGNEPATADGGARPMLRFRVVHVFDVSQTDGEPLPAPEQVAGDPGESLSRLKALIAQRGIALDSDDLPPGAFGVSRGGRISVRSDLEPAVEFNVLAHELAHEALHQAEGAERPASKTVRETEAEAVAFVVCRAAGLQSGSSSSSYIQLYEGSAETLAKSLDRIQKCAAAILAGLLAPAPAEALAE